MSRRPASLSSPLCLAALVLAASACGDAPQPPLATQVGVSSLALAADEAAAADAPGLEEETAPRPHIGIDERVFTGAPGEDVTDPVALAAAPADAAGQAVFLTCRNEPSGPYYRLQTDPVRTGAINFIEGVVHLPAVTATATAFPYLYLGGQPRQGVAADAGVYVVADGAWIPFIGVAGSGGTRNLPRETDAQGNVFVYRLAGGQDVAMRLSVPGDDALRLDVTGAWVKYQLRGSTLTKVGDAGTSSRTVVHPLAKGWRASGEDQVYKVMTTIAFPGKGNFRYLSGDFSFLGSSWRDLAVGRLATADTEPWRVPFTRARLHSACAAPADVVTPSATSALPRADAQLRLRRAARLDLPDGTEFDLRTRVMHTVRSTLTLANGGAEGSRVHYAVLPLGREQATHPVSGVLEAGSRTTVDFEALCGREPGAFRETFDVLYAAGETYSDPTKPSALAGAELGDLLYRRAIIGVDLLCEDNGRSL